MNIILSQLVLKNFKGVRDLTIDFGPLTEIHGDNATGKTTIADAFSWLLFDKDSQNKKDFDIKTLDANNDVIHGLDHEVEGTLRVDGKPLTLRKVFTEKWTKKRGSAVQEFTGHTTDYFIDGVPVKQKEYKDRIDELVDEGVFRLLTSPTFFNEQMDWKVRRKTLLEICGDVSDADVIESNPSLARLSEILGGRSIDDHRKVIAARRTEINKELDKIPVRIDEASRSMPDVEGLDEAMLDTEIHGLRVTIDQKSAELVQVQNGVQTAELEKRLREIDGEVLDIKNRAKKAAMDATEAQERMVHQLQSRVDQLQDDIDRANKKLTSGNENIVVKKDEAAKLREQWGEVNASVPELHTEDTCPTCKQHLPAEQVEAAHAKALSDFNRAKSERLERITAQGREAMAEVARLEAESAKTQAYIDEHTVAIQTANAELEAARAVLDRVQQTMTSVDDDPALIAKLDEYEQVSGKLLALRQSSTESVQNIQSGITVLRSQLAQREQDKAKFAQVANITQRIADLKAEERTLAAEFEKLEEELYLTEEFIRTKVNLLEERINSRFQYARFKLFEQQINGGLAETCETLYKGVPYGSGLNNAAKINVGLDIINTLSEHYDLYAPIFVDNAESVQEIAATNSQMIKLIVPPRFENLPFEVKAKLIASYGSYDAARKAWEDMGKTLRVETDAIRHKEAV